MASKTDPVPSPLELVYKRAAERRRVLKSGTIVLHGRNSTYSCTVRDFSTTGARLKVDPLAMVPTYFTLRIARNGIEVPCAVKWRSEGELGVQFLAPPELLALVRVGSRS